MSMADNIKFSRHSEVRGREYRKYDNFDAIEVPYTSAIPSDYDGVMGVPKSFLDRFNPDQFEIVGTSQGWYGAATKIYPRQTQVSAAGVRSTVTKLNDAPALKVETPPEGKTYYIVDDEYYVAVYARILVRHKAGA